MHILFIEDDPRLADAFAALASDIGHRADVAYDGQAAVNLIATKTYDTIFLDIGLPDIDGRELCRQLRAASVNAQACIIAVTGRADLSDAELASFDGYLLKPVTREAMESAIQNS
ncbi:response regulator [Caballeronia sp. LjRoot29]|uniref:response regulator n=1 Tax=Caballeronia sp. LjRoot29 TaxID=3342315 RepID=UPI003ECDC90C